MDGVALGRDQMAANLKRFCDGVGIHAAHLFWTQLKACPACGDNRGKPAAALPARPKKKISFPSLPARYLAANFGRDAARPASATGHQSEQGQK
jgi:hypothetical protein